MNLIIKRDIVLYDMALKIIAFIQLLKLLHQFHIMCCYDAVPLKLCHIFQYGFGRCQTLCLIGPFQDLINHAESHRSSGDFIQHPF